MTKDWNLKHVNYATQFAMLLGLTAAGLILAQMASGVIWDLMVGGSLPTDSATMLQPKYYNVNMVLQAFSTFLIFFLPAMALATIAYKEPNEFLGLTNRFNSHQIGIIFLLLIVTIPLSGAIGEINRLIPLPTNIETKFKAYELARQAQEKALIKIDSVSKYLISLLIIAVLPAIFEELYFRSGMQNVLTRWLGAPIIAIVITSFIFSIIHMSYYGFLVRFSLGVILGLLFYYSKNVWLPILFHFLFNGIQVTFLYIITIKGITRKTDIEQSFPIWTGVIALIFLIYLLIEYRKRSRQVLAVYEQDNRVNTASESQNINY